MIKQTKKELEAQLTESNQKLEDYKNTLQRLQAEFENYQKRADKEKQEIIKFANKNLLSKLLIIVDNFEHAMKNAKDDDFSQGIKMILTQLNKILVEENVFPIKSVGEKVDPFKHEIIQQIKDSNHQDDIIVEELQKGYLYNNEILRPSKVKIINNGGIKNE